VKRLGERIKKKRELLHLHLGDLARQVGVSASALSQIENAKAFPSIVTLKNIADQLHTTVGELIGENETLSQKPYIGFDQRELLGKNLSGSTLWQLSHADAQKQMDTFLVRFTKGSDALIFF
jgi:XRE family transcriptional regulator, regulator of sulfur utilization